MVIDIRAILDRSDQVINNPLRSGENFNKEEVVRHRNFITPDLVAQSNGFPNARRRRRKIRWVVPQAGSINMYINPQQMRIQEKKIITKQRTKGGYVIQYWGEELPTINLEGHTGSSGMEGINVLRNVYRAEQNAFKSVAELLKDRLREFTGVSPAGALGAASSTAAGALRGVAGGLLGQGINPSLFPTLASLATAVELHYQGWVYRGFFEDFSVTESVANGVGVFNYTLTFTVLDRRGIRTNFMPWHRQAAELDGSGAPRGEGSYNSSDTANTPLSFAREETE